MSAAHVRNVTCQTESSAPPSHFVVGYLESLRGEPKVRLRDACGRLTFELANQRNDRRLVGGLGCLERQCTALGLRRIELFDAGHVAVQKEQVVHARFGRRTGGGQLGHDELSHRPVNRLVALGIAALGAGNQGQACEDVWAQARHCLLDERLTRQPFEQLGRVTCGFTRIGAQHVFEQLRRGGV